MAERFDQERSRDWNREPGITIVPGSNYAREMEKFEQFPSKYGQSPGNPYKYRPYPKMLYRAQVVGRVRERERADEQARRFTEECQRVVKDEREYQAALENGYRETPAEAVEYLEARQRAQGQAAAERNYADRNMSEAAKAEAAEAVQEAFSERGEHLAAVPEKKRRGRPPKNSA